MSVENIPLLDNIKVAAPCQMNWNEMAGGDRARYCRSCEKNVYNLSEMSRDEAEKLLRTHEGKLCVRYYRRADGTIMTNNCPVGLRAIRKAYLKTAGTVAALCGTVFGAMMQFSSKSAPAEAANMGAMAAPRESITPSEPTEPVMGKFAAPAQPEPRFTMGDIAPLLERNTTEKTAHKPKTETEQNADDNHEDSAAR